MVSQTASGKAFEYTIALAARSRLKQGTRLEKGQAYDTAKKSFARLGSGDREDYQMAADAAMEHICHLEPYLKGSKRNLTIKIQSDQSGRSGDVRDVILCSRNWEIGISAKIGNDAVKHSRLSDILDFGRDWFEIPCSDSYMNQVRRIFKPIRTRMQNDDMINWRDLPGKEADYYVPVLEAFDAEIQRLAESNPAVPARLISYLVGKNDFYKIMKYDKCLEIQGYNLGKTLGRPSNQLTCPVSALRYPTEIIKTSIKNQNRLNMILDRGWTLSFRIHNARTKIEPSLKFDIRLIGIPDDMYNTRVRW